MECHFSSRCLPSNPLHPRPLREYTGHLSGYRAAAVWEKGIRELAQRDTVDCKISGTVASANSGWKPADLADVISFCLDSFGEDRVCFGGDWPVCTLRPSYSQWLDALKWIVRDRSQEFQRKLFYENGVRIYGI